MKRTLLAARSVLALILLAPTMSAFAEEEAESEESKESPAEPETLPTPEATPAAAAAPEAEAEAEVKTESDGAEEAKAQPNHGAGRHGIPLPGDIFLNGRFDLSLERTGYSDQFIRGGAGGLRNYHHFLFLTRDTGPNGLGFQAEVIDLTWYEVTMRQKYGNTRVLWKGGKIFVPFGSDPLFHHNYGGRSGSDQQVVPVLWTSPGASLQTQNMTPYGVRVSNDIYLVAGHALGQRDDVINLQSDLSSSEAVRMAFGDRIGLGFGPLSLWYSGYFNTLGFGRKLYMQALDVTVWHATELPVLRNFAVKAGVFRADVSGGASRGYGGSGDDYYHFADYVEVGYHLTPWLSAIARTGLFNVDNRRGVWDDGTRDTAADTSSHVLGVTARFQGLSAFLTHNWNTEKRNEVDNDLLRLMVVYEF